MISRLLWSWSIMHFLSFSFNFKLNAKVMENVMVTSGVLLKVTKHYMFVCKV